MRKKITVNLLSLFFAIIFLVGQSFIIYDDFTLLTKNIWFSIFSTIYFIVIYLISQFYLKYLFNYLDKLKKCESSFKESNFNIFFEHHPFITTTITLIICWLPYFIAFYPIILSPDPSFQMKQFMGIPNKYSSYVNLIDESVIITNHHPVIHTMLLGTCLKLGTIISNVNLGLFIYSIIQSSILISVLAYTIKFLKKLNLSFKYRLIVLLIYAFVPVFPLYAMSGVKDVIFGSLIILYIIKVYELSNINKINWIEVIKTIILMMFVFLFRNNGIHVMVLSFPFLFLIKNKDKLTKLSIIFISVLGLYYGYDKVLLPVVKITPTSVREALSIPFQQTARYVRDDSKLISGEEINNIDKVLKYSTLKTRYNSEKSDPVKNIYNRNASSTDLKNYFKSWFMGLKKAPITYVEATISNTYGYFYPVKTNWYVYYNKDNRINEDGYDYHFNNLDTTRKVLSSYAHVFPYLPVIGLIVNIGVNSLSLMVMFIYLLYKKYYHELTYLIPSFIILLVCIASPVNCYFRYALPNVFGLPVILGIFINIVRKRNN